MKRDRIMVQFDSDCDLAYKVTDLEAKICEYTRCCRQHHSFGCVFDALFVCSHGLLVTHVCYRHSTHNLLTSCRDIYLKNQDDHVVPFSYVRPADCRGFSQIHAYLLETW
jgi:hypothetical protein